MAAAVSLLALTFLFYPSEEGMAWMMWRDAPLLAAVMAACAVGLLLLWRRTPRR